MEQDSDARREPVLILGGILVFLVVTGIHPFSYPRWALDSLLVVAGLIAMFLSRHRFPLTRLSYRVLAVFAIVHLVASHYTHSQVPIGLWFQETFDLSRNHYDRFAHFMQGFAPAIFLREIFIRCAGLRPGRWLSYFVLSSCLALSALYELVEFVVWITILIPMGDKNILGSQGDIWDTQWDMLFALVGAMLALVLLSRIHDRHLCEVS